MPTFSMVALQDVPYGGRTIPKGQKFEVTVAVEAAVLSYRRRARFATKDDPDPEPEPEPQRRRYRRRDLQAEE